MKGDELVHRLRPRHHRPTRRHAASRAMLPQSLAWSVRTSPAFWVAFDSCTASMTGVAFEFLHRLYDRFRIGDFVFKCADRFPEQGNRLLLAL